MAALEADFWEYYHRDLRDLWKPNSGMTVRWVISHFRKLPPKSRVWKHLLGEKAEWGYEEHLLADIRDIVARTSFLNAIEAHKGITDGNWNNIMRKLPDPPLRPGDEKPEIKFATKDELTQLFGGGMKPRGRRK